MNHRDESGSAAMVAAVGDADAGERLRRSLERRFGADYKVLTYPSAQAALTSLRELADSGTDVALVLAEQELPDMTGVELLAQVAASHRDARRCLLISWGDRAAAGSIVKALAIGQMDAYAVKPWRQPDEQFNHAVAELLVEWERMHRPPFEAVRVVGDQWDAYSHGLQDALLRSGVPYRFYDAASPEGRELLKGTQHAGPLPVAILFNGRVLSRPTPAEIADALGVNTDPGAHAFDVTIVGSGPAGLAAAVYGASEGLRVLVVENEALGGQAGTSSMIRNYLGFPRGLSGAELTNRAYVQAWILGAQFLIGRTATGLRSEPDSHYLVLDDGSEVHSRAIVLATGVTYRRIGLDSLEALVGRGVFYGAGVTEAPGVANEDVYVVGGANSAGQAALYLSRFAAKVTILVRGSSLAEMSEYLVRDLNARDNIDVRLNTVVVEGRGDDRLRSLLLRDTASDRTEELPAAAVFIMIGASPKTDWLPAEIRRDERGYIFTGDSLPQPVPRRPPALLETSVPGVFAVGDVRAGSMKRVAAAVGEGSSAIRLVHEYLASRQPSTSEVEEATRSRR